LFFVEFRKVHFLPIFIPCNAWWVQTCHAKHLQQQACRFVAMHQQLICVLDCGLKGWSSFTAITRELLYPEHGVWVTKHSYGQNCSKLQKGHNWDKIGAPWPPKANLGSAPIDVSKLLGRNEEIYQRFHQAFWGFKII
jgi:hypothetical protein